MKRKTITLKTGARRPVFKVLNDRNMAVITYVTWPVPRGRPGKWMKISEDRSLWPCTYGLHLTTNPFAWSGEVVWNRIYLAEYEVPKKGIKREGDKFCVYRARLIRHVTIAEARRIIRRSIRAENRRINK